MQKPKELSEIEMNAWAQVILKHAYDINDWLEARAKLIKLLATDHKQAEETALRAYLSCCAEAVAGTTPLAPLSAIVEDFYSKYGMEGAKE